MVQIGYSMALIPDYSKAKKAALRILRLQRQQKSQINRYDESGIILVCLFLLIILQKTSFNV